jgi:hypothetical protein
MPLGAKNDGRRVWRPKMSGLDRSDLTQAWPLATRGQSKYWCTGASLRGNGSRSPRSTLVRELGQVGSARLGAVPRLGG